MLQRLIEGAYKQGKRFALDFLQDGGTQQETWDVALSWNPWDTNEQCADSFLAGVRLIVNAGRVTEKPNI